MIERLRDDGACGTAHGQGNALIDASDRLAENETLSGVSEKQNHFRKQRKLSEGSVDCMIHLPIYHRDSRNFLRTYIIEITHSLECVAQFGQIG
jgi:hypothetical protein